MRTVHDNNSVNAIRSCSHAQAGVRHPPTIAKRHAACRILRDEMTAMRL